MRTLTAASTVFVASTLLFGVGSAALGQSWVETHPVLIDAAGRVPGADVRAETKPVPFQEAQLPPDAGLKPDEGIKADKGPLDHPENATGESSRHE